MLHSTRKADGRTVQWDAIQWRLEQTRSDLLLILDSCNCATGSRELRPNTRKWLIGACGFSSEAAEPGEESFSRSLTDELISLAEQPFSTTELHRRVEHRLRQGVPAAGHNFREDPKHIPLGEGGREPEAIRLTSYHFFPINLIA
jgi:hypothetical protein